MESQGNDSSSSASKESGTFAFIIDFSDPGRLSQPPLPEKPGIRWSFGSNPKMFFSP